MFYAVNTARRLPVEDGEPMGEAFPLPTFIVEAENARMAEALATQIADTFEPIEVAPIAPAFVVQREGFEARFRPAPEPLADVIPLRPCPWSTPAAGHPGGLARCHLPERHDGDHECPSLLDPSAVIRWPQAADAAAGEVAR